MWGDRSRRRRVLAAGVAALLWGGAAPWTSPSAQAAEGRPGNPGSAFSWGTNRQGQLGDGGNAIRRSTTPVRVCGAAPCTSPLDRVVAVAAGGEHSLALRADGTVWAWGINFGGKLGDGTTIERSSPVQVCAVGETAPCDTFLTGVTAVAAGGSFSLALRADGTVVSWGSNLNGELGDNTTSEFRSVPSPVCDTGATDCAADPLTGVSRLAAGEAHSLALMSSGLIASWGNNGLGQLGDGASGTQRNRPGLVVGPENAIDIAAGASHSLAVLSDGTARAWGSNSNGQLGDGTTTGRTLPVAVCAVGATDCAANPLTGVSSIDAGFSHSLAVLSDRTVRSWGGNFAGQLGDGTSGNQRTTPVHVCAVGATDCTANPLTGVTSVTGGVGHSLAVASGLARAWGSNFEGQLGDGTTTNRSTPVKVCAFGLSSPCGASLSGVTAIAAGPSHSVAVAAPRADVSIALSATPATVAPGGTLTYTVTVRNNGPDNAEDVEFDDTLPPNAEFVSANPSRGSCVVPPVGSSDTVTCRIGTMGANGQATARIVVTVRAAAGGTVTNTATVSSTTPDPKTVNNTATLQTPVG
ncbi:hypothetical protein GCM10023237_02030 [Streptomyces coeruleoprunus]